MTERAMQEPTLLLLTALADAPRHGYALIQEIDAISDGRVKMRTGTLYGALDRLLQQGLIEVAAEEVVDGRARRTYALTEDGRGALTVEAERLRSVALEAERRLAAVRPSGRPAIGKVVGGAAGLAFTNSTGVFA
ncbi:PadR family transcriptional regulator [Kitasatospora sp. NPDC056327]|uniref:PadR family transcriptional regulator n=1 Tax=Kitasatospora sp. NPDC056327 TaxID=3345785 RepID=UPI0035DEF3A7